jgi:hypothetical protein
MVGLVLWMAGYGFFESLPSPTMPCGSGREFMGRIRMPGTAMLPGQPVRLIAGDGTPPWAVCERLGDLEEPKRI